jgi:hypothetical protein
MANIKEFIANMSKAGGFARPSQYEVIINPPRTLSLNQGLRVDGGNVDVLSTRNAAMKALQSMESVKGQLSLQCQSVDMPAHDLQTQNRAYGSEPGREMVQSHGYAGTIDCSFLLSSDLREKHYFELWQSLAVDNYTHKANYYDDYVSEMEIYQLSSTDEEIGGIGGDVKEKRTYGIRAIEVFPKTIGSVKFSASGANEISTLDVRFEFRQWYNIGTDSKYGTADSRLRPF